MTLDSEYLQSCKSLAIMGGTFDPIHYGHLSAAQTVKDELGLDMVLFIPTGNPAHKLDKKISKSEHRYLMTVLATSNNPGFRVSRMEIDRVGTTYTIDTIKQIRKECSKKVEIYFIIGADTLFEILGWKDSKELLTLCKFVIVTRPGYNQEELTQEVRNINSKYKSDISFINMPALDISSTNIRKRSALGKNTKYLLPEQVENYILTNKLYKKSKIDAKSIDEYVKKNLSSKRYIHSLAVADQAVRLAQRYNGNEEDAYIAGLLHDCAKDYSKQQKENLCEEYKIKIDSITKNNIDLLHPLLGAEIACRNFGVDGDILNAIRYHTTGRKKMSLLEKIIYVADVIEPNREEYEYIIETRKLAYIDLDKALITAIRLKIKYTQKRNKEVHPVSLEALKYYES